MKLNTVAALQTSARFIARAAHARCVKNGIKADMLLRQAGLTSPQIDNPELRIPVRCQIKFLDLAARALNDEFLGFQLAQTADLREIGLLYYVMASTELLGDALQRCARYSLLNNEGARFSYRADRDAGIKFDYTGPRHYPDRHQIQFLMTTLVRLCRELTGCHFMPQIVTFTLCPTDICERMSKYFGCSVVFGGIMNGMIFSTAYQRLPVRTDSHLNALLQSYCDEARASRRSNSSLGFANFQQLARLCRLARPAEVIGSL